VGTKKVYRSGKTFAHKKRTERN